MNNYITQLTDAKPGWRYGSDEAIYTERFFDGCRADLPAHVAGRAVNQHFKQRQTMSGICYNTILANVPVNNVYAYFKTVEEYRSSNK